MTDDYYQPTNTAAANSVQQSGQSRTAKGDTAEAREAEQIAKRLSETIARDLGFEEASEDQKAKILESINQRVLTAILKVIVANAPAEQAKELAEKIATDSVSENDIEQTIKDNPRILELIEKEINVLHEKMLEESRQVWKMTEEPPAAPQPPKSASSSDQATQPDPPAKQSGPAPPAQP